MLFLLLTEPGLKSMRKLQSEVDRAHHDQEDLGSNEIVQRIPFLDCCINETMRWVRNSFLLYSVDLSFQRLFPPLPVGPMQRTVPKGGGIVCENFIQAGTNVSIPLYILHRDQRYFSDPNKFLPERWAQGQKEKINQTAFSMCTLDAPPSR